MSSRERKFIIGRNIGAISVYTGIGVEEKLVHLFQIGGGDGKFSDLTPYQQGLFAAIFNVLLIRTTDKKAKSIILEVFTSAVTPENLKWLQDNQKRPCE